MMHGPVGEAGQSDHCPFLDIAGSRHLDRRGYGLRAVFVGDFLEFVGGIVESLIPACPTKLTTAPGSGTDQRIFEPVFTIDQIHHRQAAQTAARVVGIFRVVRCLYQGAYAALGNPGLEAAGPGAVR
ncbi:MAG: hypothetical protein ACD_75C00937G0001 [uncultured bacterium]|nr:MAG: hypothetical protein ACD_75C00937G0001 [uncultured bacterium]